MKRNNFLLAVIISFSFSYSYSQEEDLGTRILLNTNKLSNATHYVYSPPFIAKAIYSNMEEAKNEFPEQLMSSILSATSQSWVNYNTLESEKNTEIKNASDFEEAKNINKEKTFFELLSKLEFEANGNKIAIIKFYYHKEDKEKPIAGALVFQKNDNIWKKTSKPYTTNIAMALMVFKPDVMNRILNKKGVNDLEKTIIRNVYDASGFSFDKLLKQSFTEDEKVYLTNPLNW
jgi:hypothetical protein